MKKNASKKTWFRAKALTKPNWPTAATRFTPANAKHIKHLHARTEPNRPIPLAQSGCFPREQAANQPCSKDAYIKFGCADLQRFSGTIVFF
jgi:hypothetical protein